MYTLFAVGSTKTIKQIQEYIFSHEEKLICTFPTDVPMANKPFVYLDELTLCLRKSASSLNKVYITSALMLVDIRFLEYIGIKGETLDKLYEQPGKKINGYKLSPEMRQSIDRSIKTLTPTNLPANIENLITGLYNSYQDTVRKLQTCVSSKNELTNSVLLRLVTKHQITKHQINNKDQYSVESAENVMYNIVQHMYGINTTDPFRTHPTIFAAAQLAEAFANCK
jgi:hypothetical protein